MEAIYQSNHVIKQGLRIISSQQESEGGFLSLSSPDPHSFTFHKSYETTFLTSLILSATSYLPPSPLLDSIRQKGAGFLLKEKSTEWHFNYWSQASEYNSLYKYPDDLDDTFCALTALTSCNPDLVPGEAIAKAILTLTACEVKEGGPYRTWIVNPQVADPIWQDVDIAVNSNIATYLGLHDIEVPGIISLQEKAIKDTCFSSPYYYGWQPILYFIARSYKGVLKNRLYSYALKTLAHEVGNLAQAALVVSSLIRLGADKLFVEKRLEELVEKCIERGFPAAAVIRDPHFQGVPHFSGSRALTAALVLEAITLFRVTYFSEPKSQVLHPTQSVLLAKAQSLPPPLNHHFQEQLRRIVVPNQETILGLPSFLASCISNVSIPDSFMTKLGLVNTYGWIAYTLGDELLDTVGNLQNIPIANSCLHSLHDELAGLFLNNFEFTNFTSEILNGQEAANLWELLHCRMATSSKIITLSNVTLPDYGNLEQLAQRSGGYSISGLALLHFCGYSLRSAEIRAWQKFFNHYLIVRQLQDDAHDWKSDLQAGHLSYAISILLQEFTPFAEVRLEELENHYWKVTFPTLCQTIISQIKQAELALQPLEGAMNTTKLQELFLPYQKAVNKALRERKVTEYLFSAYQP